VLFDEIVTEILNALDEGITIIDRNRDIIFCNKKAAALDNIDIKNAIGKNILEVYPSLSEKTSTLLTVLYNGQAIYNYQQTFKNYKFEDITTINSTVPIKKAGIIIGAVEISRDITDIRKLSEENINLKSELIVKSSKHRYNYLYNENKFNFDSIIGISNSIKSLKYYAEKAAHSSSPVLIYGETGTGKELFVQSIHNASLRKDKPFVTQNCAALPFTLLESILFGTVKGSFTGAEDRMGLFEIANNGTLYLDEINSMPVELQAKLLRVLQDGYIRRLGDVSEKKVDVRIIASINEDPLYCIKTGKLRNDLYYRLNVIELRIPELRKRKSDIPVLTKHFISMYNKIFNADISGISNDAMEKLMSYNWPGNVRELQHLIECIMNFKKDGIIKLNDLPDSYKNIKNNSLMNSVGEEEKKIITEAIRAFDNNVSKTAEYLNIPRSTLQYKLKKYKIVY
jgi:arginine utilization regulatory protein